MSTVGFELSLHLYVNVNNSWLGAFTHGRDNLATNEKEPAGEKRETP